MTFILKSLKSGRGPGVVIVGSGPSGVAVADTLRHRGIGSVIFEAGSSEGIACGRTFRSMAEYRAFVQPSWRVDEANWNYEADRSLFDWIRVRSAGGRSLRWRGWLARPLAANFTIGGGARGRWPFTLAEMGALIDRASLWLHACSSKLDERFISLSVKCGDLVIPKTAASSSDKMRPFCSFDRLGPLAAHSLNVGLTTVRDLSVVTRILCENNRVAGVEYRDLRTGETRRTKALAVVLAASPIETTRLLLCSALERQTDAFALIGARYLDHIAASFLTVLPHRVARGAIPGLLQQSATMPELSACTQTFRAAYGGFTIELNGPNPAAMYEPEILLAAGLDPVADALKACISVNAIGELLRSPLRSIGLAKRLDNLGRPMPRISIGWGDSDEVLAVAMEHEAERVATILAGTQGRAVKVRDTLTLGGTGTSHEAGTCPIGWGEADSVVNRDGQVHGITGLYIADASLLPTALDCHPTLTVVSLALNTADGVTRFMNGGS